MSTQHNQQEEGLGLLAEKVREINLEYQIAKGESRAERLLRKLEREEENPFLSHDPDVLKEYGRRLAQKVHEENLEKRKKFPEQEPIEARLLNDHNERHLEICT